MALPNGDLITTVFDPQMAYPVDKRMQVDTLNSRDSMSMFIRWEGMEVYVLENKTKYILQGGRSNEFWKESGTGSGTGGTTFVGQFESADLLPTSGRSAGDYAFVGTGDDFVQYNWDNIAGQWVMAEGQTDMASEFFHIGYKTPLRRPAIFPLFPKDVLVQTSGDFVFAPETSVARFIFTGEVTAIRGIETAAADREIKLVNRTGSDIILRDKSSGIPSGSGFDFGGTDYTWVNGSEITIKGDGTYWQLAPNNNIAFSDHLDSVNAQVSVGSDGVEVISDFFNVNTKQYQTLKRVTHFADGTEMTNSKADGFIYFKVSDKFFVDTDYKATGVVNVKKFGAVHDYVTSSESTDNNDAIQAAIAFMKLVSNHTTASRKSAPTLLFPKGDQGSGYGCSQDLDFGGGYSVIMEAPIYKTGTINSASDAFVTIGSSSETERIDTRNLDYKLWVRSGISPEITWTGTEKYAGIEVKNIQRSRINIKETIGFEVGQRFIGRNAGFSYNKVRIMNSLNNRVHIICDSISPLGDTGAYITSCDWDLGRVGNDSTVAALAFDRYGIIIQGTGYTPESLTFKNGIMEGLLNSSTPNGFEGIPVLIRSGNSNKFLDFRHESNSEVFMKILSGSNNEATLTVAVPIGSLGQLDKDDSVFLNDSGNNIGNLVKTRRTTSFKGFDISKIVYSSGDLASKTVQYNDTSLHIAGMARVLSTGAIAINSVNATIAGSYINLPNGAGLGIEIDTTIAKRLIIQADEHPDHFCRCYYYAYDESGTVLPSSNIEGSLSNSTVFGANGRRDFYTGYERRVARFIKLSPLVSKVRIIFQGIDNPDGINTGGWLKSFNVISVDGLPSSGNVIQFNHPYNYATKPPEIGSYVKGKLVLNYDFTANPQTLGWVATATGIGLLANWLEIRNFSLSASTQAQANAGTNSTTYITPQTLSGYSGFVPNRGYRLESNGNQLVGSSQNGSITRKSVISTDTNYPVDFAEVYTFNGPGFERTWSLLKDRDTDSLYVQTYDTSGVGQGWVQIGGANNFNQLTDTPASKTGNKNKTVKVSNDETTHVYVADGVDVRNETSGGSISLALTDGFIASRLNFTSATAVTLQGLSSANGQSSLTLVNPHATNNLTIKHNGAGTVKYISPTATDFVIPPKTAARFEIVGDEIYPIISS